MITKNQVRETGRWIARFLLLFSWWKSDENLPSRVAVEVILPYLLCLMLICIGVMIGLIPYMALLPDVFLVGLFIFVSICVGTKLIPWIYRVVMEMWKNLEEGEEKQKPKNDDISSLRIADEYKLVEDEDFEPRKRKRLK